MSIQVGAATAPKRRGRPVGSADRTAGSEKVGLEQFAALRAWLSGLAPADACRRFLTSSTPPANEAAALRRLIPLLSHVVHTARHRPGERQEQLESLRAASVLADCLASAQARRRVLLARDRLSRLRRQHNLFPAAAAPAAPSPAQPAAPAFLESLEAFQAHYIEQQGHDPDLSEAEWLELMEDATKETESEQPHQDAPVALSALTHAGLHEPATEKLPVLTASPAQALAALDTCRWVVERRPKATDLVHTWFTGATEKRLVQAGLLTLFAVADLVNQRGHRWWTQVPGLGPARARRIVDWLAVVAADDPSLRLRPDLFGERPALPAPAPDTPVERQLWPLQVLVDARALGGSAGVFRLPQANLLGARNDLEALAIALGKYADQPHTLAVYGREVLRFALWCYLEKRKPVSSITVADARDFRLFLDNIPLHWINPAQPRRGSPGWRPFRGQLDDASKRKALTSVHVVLDQLLQTGYLAGNAMAGLVKRSALKRPSLNIGRSFDEGQWEHVQRELDALPSPRRLAAIARGQTSPARQARRRWLEEALARRMRALVRLLHSTGIRRDECRRALRDDLQEVRIDGARFHTLRVTGKGNKLRDVYVPDPVVRLLRAHWADVDLMLQTSGIEAARLPLIGTLTPPVGSDSLSAAALSADGMYKAVKRFLLACGRSAPSAGLGESAFQRASLHWMRHTFGLTLTNARVDLRTVQAAMGHSDINTTATYSRQQRDRMVRELHTAMPASMRGD